MQAQVEAVFNPTAFSSIIISKNVTELTKNVKITQLNRYHFRSLPHSNSDETIELKSVHTGNEACPGSTCRDSERASDQTDAETPLTPLQ